MIGESLHIINEANMRYGKGVLNKRREKGIDQKGKGCLLERKRALLEH